ncbi:MAG: mechanosensitive ion channel [Flavobacteriales bacterium]|nr:mechanosensitive ion channel [Flavobacteriales bacterium]
MGLYGELRRPHFGKHKRVRSSATHKSHSRSETPAEALSWAAIDGHPAKVKDPAPQVVVGELADSSVNFSMRVWAKSEDYWSVYFDMHEQVKKLFDAKGISIPFPQMRAHSK